MKARNLRILVSLGVVLVVVLGVACKLGIGTLCSLGPDGIFYLCPLGFLETVLAGRSVFPVVWLPLLFVLGSIVVFGRYFCGWICPAALIDGVVHLNGNKPHNGKQASATRTERSGRLPASSASQLSSTPNGTGSSVVPGSRYLVLAGALISTAVFGFPVFCLVCPVGLFFGTIFAVARLLSIQQPSVELLLYPAILGLELIALKNWCRAVCPLGALLSLLSGLNRFFRPTVNRERCFVSQGINCHACRNTCPQAIDLRGDLRTAQLMNCTKCKACSERCPVGAISFPFKAQRG